MFLAAKRVTIVCILAALTLLATAQEAQTKDVLALTETQEFAGGFGFSIDYPGGWFAANDRLEPVTVISELEEDFQGVFDEGVIDHKGIGVSLDHRSLAFMYSIGLQRDPTMDDLVEFNASFFEWGESFREESELFGYPAIRIQYIDGFGNAGISYQGFTDGDRVFIFNVKGPSGEALDAFLLTWEAMLAKLFRFSLACCNKACF